MADSTYNVLLVDDDKFLLDMYALKFQQKGWKVNAAIGGNEALEVLRGGFKPHAIVLDIVMPGMDGFQFLEAAKKENLVSGCVLIVLSNQGQDVDIERAKQSGANGYIVKANSIPSEVLEKVESLIKEQAATATHA